MDQETPRSSRCLSLAFLYSLPAAQRSPIRQKHRPGPAAERDRHRIGFSLYLPLSAYRFAFSACTAAGRPSGMAHAVVAAVGLHDGDTGTLQGPGYLCSRAVLAPGAAGKARGRESTRRMAASYQKSGDVECQCQLIRTRCQRIWCQRARCQRARWPGIVGQELRAVAAPR